MQNDMCAGTTRNGTCYTAEVDPKFIKTVKIYLPELDIFAVKNAQTKVEPTKVLALLASEFAASVSIK